MMVLFQGHKALLQVLTAMIDELSKLGILRLICNMVVNVVSVLVAVLRVADVEWVALPDHD